MSLCGTVWMDNNFDSARRKQDDFDRGVVDEGGEEPAERTS
jgi:hypothetical protein